MLETSSGGFEVVFPLGKQPGRAPTTLFRGFFSGELAVFYRAVSRSPPYYSGDEMMATGIPSSINSTCHGYFHIH